jgi:hypothetical protein
VPRRRPYLILSCQMPALRPFGTHHNFNPKSGWAHLALAFCDRSMASMFREYGRPTGPYQKWCNFLFGGTVFWRPITAIRSGDIDGNAATDLDAAWTPWLDFFPAGTPAHPEYPSGHSTASGAAAAILSDIFGDDTAFSVTSDVRPGTRNFPSFSAAVEEIANARVFWGIHFRISCTRGNLLGQAVTAYVVAHSMRAD